MLVLVPGLVALVIIEPYRMRRVTSFMDPWQDQLGAGYQLSNADGDRSGRVVRGGPGRLGAEALLSAGGPYRLHLSVIAEELGLVGVCGGGPVRVAAGRAFWLGLRCVEIPKRHFSGYIAFGIALWMALQSFVSVGVNLGVLPPRA